MITHKTRWLLAGLVCLALWPAHASAQGGLWETYMDAATAAYQRGDFVAGRRGGFSLFFSSSRTHRREARCHTILDHSRWEPKHL